MPLTEAGPEEAHGGGLEGGDIASGEHEMPSRRGVRGAQRMYLDEAGQGAGRG